MDVIASDHPATVLWEGLLGQVARRMQARGAHGARTVVLLPFAQLMPLARRAWAALHPDGFAPRFETTMNWAGRLGLPSAGLDVRFDRGRDLLSARTWLERAGLAARAAALAPRLVDAAWQAAGVAAAVPPAQRGDWAAQARGAVTAGLDAPALALEAAIARIAVEWAAASSYPADVLLAGPALDAVDLLVVCEGLTADPLAAALAQRAGDRALCLSLQATGPAHAPSLHAAADPAEEAEQAAACVVRRLQAGQAPVALAAVDRVLTREVRALLGVRGIAVRDETGWKLSTTRAGAQVMGLLRAGARDAATDDVIDWLKHARTVPAASLQALERRARRAGVRRWGDVSPRALGGGDGAWTEWIVRANAWRQSLAGPRTVPRWQEAVRAVLGETGAWAELAADPAGQGVLQALALTPEGQAEWDEGPQAERRLSLGEFTAWCNEVLEGAAFVPPAPESAQVVVLPLQQVLARPFAAVVVAGCDEVRLPASPEPPGAWTPAQRRALGLPTREALEREQRAGWAQLLRMPGVDLLWRRSDGGGEPLLPSPLVQALPGLGEGGGADPRQARAVASLAVERPLPTAAALPVRRLSASAYEDLRRCPYRFFALRQLGLQEAAEIDAELDKRDFGNWLHQVLRDFHQALRDAPDADRAALLDRCAADATTALALPDGEFLPFSAAWPQVREGYLGWLAGHEAEGHRFLAAEEELTLPLGPLELFGRIDRIDVSPDGRRFVMDYKTEGLPTTQDRVRQPFEDTQLAFYAALLPDDTLRAAYVNVGERGVVRRVEQEDVVAARTALVEGILSELGAIHGGATLPALGEGMACGFCAARGLCRRDHWHG